LEEIATRNRKAERAANFLILLLMKTCIASKIRVSLLEDILALNNGQLK